MTDGGDDLLGIEKLLDELHCQAPQSGRSLRANTSQARLVNRSAKIIEVGLADGLDAISISRTALRGFHRDERPGAFVRCETG